MNQSQTDNPSTTGDEGVLSVEELGTIDAYWRACNYLALGMLYLRDNPLLREPLTVEHLKKRLVGHWGSDPGQSFVWVHLNRLIKRYDLNAIFISEKGSINTPLGLTMLNQVDRFSPAIDVIDRMPRLTSSGAHVKSWLQDQILDHTAYARKHGIDKPEIQDWKWTS